jgi:hypothetical protein
MAHFAEIDATNTVVRVLVVPDSEQDRGQQFLANDLLLNGKWIQTSYNADVNGFRGKFAGISDIYDPVADTFVSSPTT